jgi:hypothetical protein
MEVEIVRGCVYMIHFIVGLLGVICAQNTIVLVDSIVLFICSYWIVIRLIIIIIYDSCSKTTN